MARKDSSKLQAEYNMNVGKIQKALKALEKADPESVTLDRYKGFFRKSTSKQPNYNTIRAMNKKAKEVLNSGVLSLEGHERSIANAIETLHSEGYEFINRKNFNSFMRFLDDARARGLGSLYSSEQILEAINNAKNKGLSEGEIKKNIERWSKQMGTDTSGKVIEVSNPKPLTVKRYGSRSK